MSSLYRYHLGIDPGVSGAVACIDLKPSPRVLAYAKVPTQTLVASGRRRTQIDVPALVRIFEALPQQDITALIEDVHSMPGQGIVSTFTFGVAFGQMLGLLHCRRIPFSMSPPQVWKRRFALIGKDKNASRALATTMLPQSAHIFSKRTDDGVAEACLLALFSAETT